MRILEFNVKNKIFTKLDRRNTGFGYWEYYINRPKRAFNSNLSLYECQQTFFSWREWCWQTWGPSKELDDWLEDIRQNKDAVSHNEYWCFQNRDYSTRIYLKSNKELSLFLLKWSQ